MTNHSGPFHAPLTFTCWPPPRKSFCCSTYNCFVYREGIIFHLSQANYDSWSHPFSPFTKEINKPFFFFLHNRAPCSLDNVSSLLKIHTAFIWFHLGCVKTFWPLKSPTVFTLLCQSKRALFPLSWRKHTFVMKFMTHCIQCKIKIPVSCKMNIR